jgi:hypothetical protein
MNINPEKFDTDLGCDLEPFGYMEDNRLIKTLKAGEIMLISFGAMNRLGHFSPEFGGVALVHLNPDVFLAVKYIPWDAEARRKELMKQYKYLKDNHQSMSPADVTEYFYVDCNYILPAKKQRLREEYIQKIAEENKIRAQEMQAAHEREDKLQAGAAQGRPTRLARKRVAVDRRNNTRTEVETEEPDPIPLKKTGGDDYLDGEKLISLDNDEEE